jgi:plastocyanin
MATQLRTAWLLLLLFSASGWATNHTVVVGGSGDVFSPKTLTINAGDTVTFTNTGGFHNAHSTSGPTSFDCSNDCAGNSAPSGSAWSDTLTFPTTGTINYQCDEHASMGMVGSIIVNAVTPPPFVIGGYTSGSWYGGPTQSGHGFLLEVDNAANNMLAIWFVYAPDGSSQNWVYAQGPFDPTKNTVTLPAILPTGARFPPNFNTADLTDTPWGSLTFSFSDCNNGSVSWISTLPGYGSGTLPIVRLTQIAGTTCPQ